MHEDRVVDADGGDQQQAEQAEQGQRLAQPAEASQAAERGEQWQGDDAQGTAEAKRQDQQHHDQRARQQLELCSTDLGGGEHPVEVAEAVHQLHAFKVVGLQAQQRRIVQALQADDGGHALSVGAQPQGAPWLA
ncbi:hypothetical protein D3C81_1212780 [compost metagenome]